MSRPYAPAHVRAPRRLAGELGVLALKGGYARWSEDGSVGLAEHALAALRELRAASASLG